MKLLELFSGTGSVGRVAQELSCTVVSLDLKDADINQDILKWDYKNIDKDFGFVWASPPCTEYSIAKTTGVRKIDEANEIAKKTIEIIKYFEPKYWFIENPQTGLLKQQFMKDFAFFDVDYCKYGMPYRKRTRIWTHIKTWTPKPLCKKDCGHMEGNRHRETAQRMPSGKKETWKENHTLFKQRDLHRIPEKLIREIFSAIN